MQALKKFEEMGARVKELQPRAWSRSPFVVDVKRDKQGEFFTLEADEGVQLQVLDVDAAQRHLVLMAKEKNGDKHRMLCGHDEREWFVASIPDRCRITTVRQAMEALKPEAAHRSQGKKKVRAKNRNRRRNRGFVRQGEWFFIPTDFNPPGDAVIHEHEPLSRGAGSKDHMVQYLYRIGGRQVYVSSKAPQGISPERWNRLSSDDRKNAFWRLMMFDPDVYVKGRVSHADHATITLDTWHKVEMNTENEANSWSSTAVAFLD